MQITFKDVNCKYTGVWQENGEGAVVSYSQIAFLRLALLAKASL